MNQLSRRSLSSLGATFVWQVRFGIFGYVCVCVCVCVFFFFFFKSFWLYVIMMCVDFILFYFIFIFIFFQVWMYEYFGVGPQVREDVDGIYPRFLYWLPKYHL